MSGTIDTVRIDLHTHSTESDGTDTPSGLVATAGRAGLDVVALTDHDTTAGWAEAESALDGRLRLVPGAELSCTCPDGRGGSTTVHLLAYLFDPDSPALVSEQRRLRHERRQRLSRMAERMAGDGFPIDPDDILGQLPADSPGGRPHLARALVRAGVVSSVNEAFEQYLHDGGPYHLARADTPVHRAIEMIRAAGGVTVFGHPFARGRGRVVRPSVLGELAEHGLTGIEVDHPDHDDTDRAALRALTHELGLVPTGSSDYHGTNKTLALGQELTPPESLQRLLDGAQGKLLG